MAASEEFKRVVWEVVTRFQKAQKDSRQLASEVRNLDEAEKQHNATSAASARNENATTTAQDRRKKSTSGLRTEVEELASVSERAASATDAHAKSNRSAQQSESQRGSTLRGFLGTLGQYASKLNEATKNLDSYQGSAKSTIDIEQRLTKARISQQAAAIASARAQNTLRDSVAKLNTVRREEAENASRAERAELGVMTAHTASKKAAADLAAASQKLTNIRRNSSADANRAAQAEARVAAAHTASVRATLNLQDADSRLRAVRGDSETSARRLSKAETEVSVAHLAVARAAHQAETATRDVDRAMADAASGGGGGGTFRKVLHGIGDDFNGVGRAARDLSRILRIIGFGAIGAAISPLLGLISALSAGFVGLVGAIAPAAGVLATLPGLFGAAATSVGALFLGLGGVGAALKAYQQQQTASARNAAKASTQQESASRKALQAANDARSAQIQQINNAKELRDAEEAVTDARRDQANSARENAEKIKEAQRQVKQAVQDAADTELRDTQAIKDAQQGVTQARSDAASQAKSDAQDIITAQQAVVAAEAGVAQAEKDVSSARLAASQNIQQMANSLKDLALQAEGAGLSVEQAQQELTRTLNDPASTDLQRRQAAYQLRVAKEQQRELVKQQQDTQKQLGDAQKKGIEGSDEVVQAKQAEKDANDQVAVAEKNLSAAKDKSAKDAVESQRSILKAQQELVSAQRQASRDQEESAQNVAKAQQDAADAQREAAQDQTKSARDVRDAIQDLSGTQRKQQLEAKNTATSLKLSSDAAESAADGIGKTSGQIDVFQQALAKVPPSARGLVKELIKLKPKLDELKETAAKNMVPGLEIGLHNVLDLFPIFNKGLGQTSKAVGEDVASIGKNLNSGPFHRDLPKLFDSNAKLISLFGRSLNAVLNIVRSVATAAIPLTEWLATSATKWLENVAAMAETNEENGKLRKFFLKTKDVLSQLGRILHNVGRALFETFRHGVDLGKDMLDSIESLTKRWADWTHSIEGGKSLDKWFAGAKPVLSETAKLIGAMARGFAGLSDSKKTANFIAQIRTELGPAVEKLLADLGQGEFGASFIHFLTTVANLLDTLVSSGGGTLTLMVKTLTDFLTVVNAIIKNVPGGTGTLGAFFTTIAVFKVAGLLATVTGLKGLAKAIREVTKASKGAEAVGIGGVIGRFIAKKKAAGAATEAVAGAGAAAKAEGAVSDVASAGLGISAVSAGKGAKQAETAIDGLEKTAKTKSSSIGKILTGLSGAFLLAGKKIGGAFKTLGTKTFSLLGKALPGVAKNLGKISGVAGPLSGSLGGIGSALLAAAPAAIGAAGAIALIGGGLYYLHTQAQKNAIPDFDDIHKHLVIQTEATGNNVKGYKDLTKSTNDYYKQYKSQTDVANKALQFSAGSTQAYINEQMRQRGIAQQNAKEALAHYKADKGQLDTLTQNQGVLAQSLDMSGAAALRLADRFGIDLSKNSDKTNTKMTTLIDNVTTLQSDFGITSAQAINLGDRLGVDLSRGFQTVQDDGRTAAQVISDYRQEVRLSHNPQATMQQDMQVLTDKSRTLQDQIGHLNNLLDGLINNNLDASQAADDFRSALNSQTQTAKNNGGALKGNTQAAIDNRSEVRRGVTAAEEHAKAVYKQTGNLGKAKKTLIEDLSALQKNSDKTYGNRDAVRALLDKVGGLPNKADKALERLQNFAKKTDKSLGNMKKNYTIGIAAAAIGAGTNQKDTLGFGGNVLGRNATGGFIRGPGTGTSDSIPSWLSNGEYVINARSTAKYRPLLEQINSRKYKDGGLVTTHINAGKYADGGDVTAPAARGFEIGLDVNLDAWHTDLPKNLSAVMDAWLQSAQSYYNDLFGNAAGGNLLNFAKNFLGVPYVWGGTDPNGFDCSGLTSFTMQHFGINSPRTAAQQQDWAYPEPKNAAAPGDLVFWGDPAHHVAFYVGGNRILEAPDVGDVVKYASLYDHPTFGRPRGLEALGGGATGGNARAAAQQYLNQIGMGNQFPSVDYVFSHESGWRSDAQNPTSSAYGIPQFLSATWAAYGGKTADPARQAIAGIKYMIDRYGSPRNAEAFWRSHHWYRKGGPVEGSPMGFHSGGHVPGSGHEDRVPAMLAPGEFVLNKRAVREIGLGNLHSVNGRGGRGAKNPGTQYFHAGGPVLGIRPGMTANMVRSLYTQERMNNYRQRHWGGDLTSNLRRRFPREFKPTAAQTDNFLTYMLQQVSASPGNSAIMGGVRGKTRPVKPPKDRHRWLEDHLNFNHMVGHFTQPRQTMSPLAMIMSTDKILGSSRLSRNTDSMARSAIVRSLQGAKKDYGSDLAGMKRRVHIQPVNGDWGSYTTEAMQHVLYHSLGIKHDDFLTRPWNPLTAAEKALRDQTRANKLQSEFNGYLEKFALWGYSDLVAKMEELGVADGMEIARSAAKSKVEAGKLNAAYKRAAELALDTDTENDYLQLLTMLSNSKSQIGLRDVAMALQIPDYGVVDLWDKVGKQVTAKINGGKLVKLLSDIKSFRAGTFYANTGGQVPGQGSGDTVPAMLTPGEFVLRKAVAQRLGIGNLDALNSGGVQKFATGGLVQPFSMATPEFSTVAAGNISASHYARESAGAGREYVYNFETTINNPTAENSVASMNKALRKQAALRALPGGE